MVDFAATFMFEHVPHEYVKTRCGGRPVWKERRGTEAVLGSDAGKHRTRALLRIRENGGHTVQESTVPLPQPSTEVCRRGIWKTKAFHLGKPVATSMVGNTGPSEFTPLNFTLVQGYSWGPSWPSSVRKPAKTSSEPFGATSLPTLPKPRNPGRPLTPQRPSSDGRDHITPPKGNSPSMGHDGPKLCFFWPPKGNTWALLTATFTLLVSSPQ